jgi:predicted DCC family thiol-disulfide oxidoreductase YuxK
MRTAGAMYANGRCNVCERQVQFMRTAGCQIDGAYFMEVTKIQRKVVSEFPVD